MDQNQEYIKTLSLGSLSTLARHLGHPRNGFGRKTELLSYCLAAKMNYDLTLWTQWGLLHRDTVDRRCRLSNVATELDLVANGTLPMEDDWRYDRYIRTSVPELRKMCVSRGIKGTSTLNKRGLINYLVIHDKNPGKPLQVSTVDYSLVPDEIWKLIVCSWGRGGYYMVSSTSKKMYNLFGDAAKAYRLLYKRTMVNPTHVGLVMPCERVLYLKTAYNVLCIEVRGHTIFTRAIKWFTVEEVNGLYAPEWDKTKWVTLIQHATVMRSIVAFDKSNLKHLYHITRRIM